jgi:DNA-binding NarL/FixJ family response regulator
VGSHVLQSPSRRELEVLELIAEGFSNRHIADRLCLSVETVKSHVRALLKKLGANSRAHAVAIAFREGLLAFWMTCHCSQSGWRVMRRLPIGPP